MKIILLLLLLLVSTGAVAQYPNLDNYISPPDTSFDKREYLTMNLNDSISASPQFRIVVLLNNTQKKCPVCLANVDQQGKPAPLASTVKIIGLIEYEWQLSKLYYQLNGQPLSTRIKKFRVPLGCSNGHAYMDLMYNTESRVKQYVLQRKP